MVYSPAGALCDIIIGNDVEFGFMAGDYDRGLEKARSLVAGTAQIAVYKMSEKGAVMITPNGEFRTGIYPSDPVKSNGAGDSFMGALVASLAQGRSLHDAVLRGSASAAMVVSRVGCSIAMPDEAELTAFQSRHPPPD